MLYSARPYIYTVPRPTAYQFSVYLVEIEARSPHIVGFLIAILAGIIHFGRRAF